MAMRALQWEGWKKELEKMIKKREEMRSSQALGSSESALRLGVFSPWLDSLFIAAGVDLGLMQKIFLIYLFDIFWIFFFLF